MLFGPPLYYKSIWFTEKQDYHFWNEIAIAFLEKKYNIETLCNGFPIFMYQGGPSYKLYFIAINLKGQPIISPNKKSSYYSCGWRFCIVGLKFMEIWMLKKRYCYNHNLIYSAWFRVKMMTKQSAVP